MTPIVLKDRLAGDVTFNYTGTTQNGIIYDAAGSTLLSRKRLTLQMTESAKVNRIKWKLSVPSVCASAPDCVPTVSYTLVASGDISVVKFSTAEDREDLQAMASSLAAHAAVESLVVDGAFGA